MADFKCARCGVVLGRWGETWAYFRLGDDEMPVHYHCLTRVECGRVLSDHHIYPASVLDRVATRLDELLSRPRFDRLSGTTRLPSGEHTFRVRSVSYDHTTGRLDTELETVVGPRAAPPAPPPPPPPSPPPAPAEAKTEREPEFASRWAALEVD